MQNNGDFEKKRGVQYTPLKKNKYFKNKEFLYH